MRPTSHGTVLHGHRWCAGLMLAPLRQVDIGARHMKRHLGKHSGPLRINRGPAWMPQTGRNSMIKEWTQRHKVVRMAGFASTIALGSLLPALALAADIVL